ncbi:GMC family oxidoreductase [Desmospora profundinema]|uniref:Choline dehydrogenase-like flavoprotein n=1 Tax=Desmospora profundinema TaxID=1571184 RepID=A0ABU1IHX8_9BACL|nr:GMC family oxidoreductase [Desmospora profundinema]MDR6224375.1 choline dehydrogenase-like flavoprotein [Desmospora profundinema]
MKVVIGDKKDTLRKLSQTHRMELKNLLSWNPHIPDVDAPIDGVIVYLSPSQAKTAAYNRPVAPPCPPIPAPLKPMPQWISLTPLEKMEKTDYDVLIVGSGAGGGATLWRLCEQWGNNGKKVGVVERGDLLLPTHSQNIPTLDFKRRTDFYLTVATPIGAKLPDMPGSLKVFALGGKTLFWWTVTPRMDEVDLQDWPVSFTEMNKYYNIAENVMNVNKRFTKGSSMTEQLVERLRNNHFPETTPLPLAADLQPTRFGQVHSNVFFSSILFLARALFIRPFDLAVKTRGVEVLTERNRVVGLRVMTPDKKSHYLKAKNVVLSTNTFETARILLYSRIPGEAIGHYLANHSKIVGVGRVSRGDFPEVLGSMGILVPRTAGRPYQIQFHGPMDTPDLYLWYPAYQEKPLKAEWEFDIQTFGVVESRYENRVYLDPSRVDEDGIPEFQVDFQYSEKDLEVIRQMEAGTRQAIADMGIATLVPDEYGQDLCLRPPGDDTHELGSCRMGVDPATSTTNPFGQVHQISGLYVADNSILPTAGAANPTLSTVALAIRTADYIVNRLG